MKINYREQMLSIWKGDHEISKMREVIVNYAEEKGISWRDNNSKLCKALKFFRQIFRFFNDGDAIKGFRVFDDVANQKYIDSRVELVKEVYVSIVKKLESK